MPVIRCLIEGNSNFGMALELMENSKRLIDQKLSPLFITQYASRDNCVLRAFKVKLEESELKAKKRLEQDFLFQLDAYLNSRIQFANSEDPKYA